MDITSMTVVELAAMLRAGSCSSRELTEAILQKIDSEGSRINAYITLTAEKALETAERIDRRRANGENVHTLGGIPYALKDNIVTKDIPTTCASDMLRDFVPGYSATVYNRISGCGGVLMGKTNMDEFAMGSSTERSIIGPTLNPLMTGKRYSAGGSSGGSAAAVAAGEAVWAIGTDTGGSARQPASFCGLVSMKPTYGRVSRYGLVEFASSLDTICPITRTVKDNAVCLAAMSGPDGLDMTALPETDEYLSGLEEGVGGLRFGLIDDSALEGCDPGTVRCLHRAARMLETLGAEVEYVSLPEPLLTQEVYLVIASAEASSNLARYDGLKYGAVSDERTVQDIIRETRVKNFGEEVRRRILTGTYSLSSQYGGGYYRKIRAFQMSIIRQYDAVFSSCDAILLPTAAGTAFPLGKFESNPTSLYDSDRFSTAANIIGGPALTIPSGGDGQLPYGMMLMGKRGSERLLYRAGYALETSLKEMIEREVER